ncbi:MAG TPA: MFS transporter [Acidimicrobiia bacterium]
MTEANSEPKALGPNYRRLWTAFVASNLGDGVSGVAYPWLASAVTRNPVHIALIGVATRIPWLIFTLPAGVITDRSDRRRLVVWMDVIRTVLTLGVALAVVTLGGNLPNPDEVAAGEIASSTGWLLGILYLTALVFGFAEVLHDNSAQTLMPSLVRPDQLQRANGRLWGAETVANSFLGPPLGGVLLGIGYALPFFFDAGTFAVAAALVAMLVGNFRPKRESPEPRPSFMTELKQGFRWLWRHDLLRSLAITLGILNAANGMVFATFVLFAQEVLQLSATQFGLIATAGAAGGVIGSFVAPGVSKRLGSGPALYSSIGVGIATDLVIGLTSQGWVAWAMLGLASLSAVVWNVITVSLRQEIIPDELLGRVNSVYRFFGWGMIPIGTFLGGVLVAVTEDALGRETGLRIPFFVAAALEAILLIYALPRLSSSKIAAAREAASAGKTGSR